MDAKALANYISIPLPPAWEASFPQAMEVYDQAWLDRWDFDAILDYYGFPGDFYRQRLHEELDLLKQDSVLNRVCWLMHYILFYGQEQHRRDLWKWSKDVIPFAQHGSSTTCVVALLAAQPLHQENMRLRGYDQEQIAFHKTGIRNCWVGQHESFGMDGINFNMMSWGSHFVRCELVRLGRLNYEYAPFKYPSYQAQFGASAGFVDLHIPGADNGLQDGDVESSLSMAAEKLPGYFPELRGKQIVYCVSSWLLSPQLKQMLKPDSNILKFQNRFHITNYYEGTGSFLSNVFQITAPIQTVDLAALPEDTHLRREVKKRLLAGEPLQNGRGYLLRPQ